MVWPEADDTEMLTVWFSLLDALIEVRLLQIVPYSHREGLVIHCPGKPGGLSIPDALLEKDRAIPVPLKREDALFLIRASGWRQRMRIMSLIAGMARRWLVPK